MIVEVASPSSKRLKQMSEKFALQRDDWNDYSFNTLYHLHYKHGSEPTDVTFIGSVKILKQGQSPKDGSLIQKPFTALGPEYVSVGTSLDYYQRLNDIPENDRKMIVDALQDVVAHPLLVEKFMDEPGWTKSLFRDDSAWPQFLQDARMLHEGSFSALPDMDEEFSFIPAQSENRIDFNFGSPEPTFYSGPYRKLGPSKKRTLLPDRIIVLVGRNGSGKSTLLSRLAHVAFASPQARRSKKMRALGRLEPNAIGFMRVITISYSAFDSFVVPGLGSRDITQITEDIENGNGRFIFCGLRDIVAEIRDDLTIKNESSNIIDENIERRKSTRLKSIDTLADEFGRLIARIQKDDQIELLTAAMAPLLSEASFVDLNDNIDELLQSSISDATQLFLRFSTGHKIVLHVVASLVANVKPRSLVLFDEPETHLHPPLMAALMHSVRLVLSELNAFCVVATHSPVLLQETLVQHVRYIRRVGDVLEVKTPGLETFGENVGILTYNSFGLTASSTDYHVILDLLVKGCDSLEEIEEFFPNGLSGQAFAYVNSRFAQKNKNR
jgi:predicted ATPase